METHDKSINQQQFDDIPPLETQREIYKDLENEKKLIVGEDVYLISLQWLQKFKYGIESQCGPINNKQFISNNKFSLKNKREKFDYEIISKDMWEILHAWYQGGPEIKLQVVSTNYGPKAIISDLKLKCYFKNYEPKDIITNEYVRTKDFHEQIMKMFNLSLDKETRLWDYYQKEFKNEIKDGNELSKYNLIENQEIYLDIKENGIWFKDKHTTNSHMNIIPIGLQDIKKTCFLNVFVQCLLYNIPLMKSILIDHNWDNDIRGTKFNIANVFSELMKFVWLDKNKSVNQGKLKNLIEQYAPQFLNNFQCHHSSFFTDLFERFHKFINRKNDANNNFQSIVGCYKNDVEFKEKNDSIIIDTFYGQIKSELLCPNCGLIKADFEPYCIISPPTRDNKFKITFIPLKYTDPYIKMELNIPANSSFTVISKIVSDYLKRNVKVILGFYRIMDDINWGIRDFELSQPHICAFEVENFDSYHIPCTIRMNEKNKFEKSIGKPFLLSFDHSHPTEEEISDCAYNHLKCLSDPFNEFNPSEYIQDIVKSGKYYAKSVDKKLSNKPIVAEIPTHYTGDKSLKYDKEYPKLEKSIIILNLNPLFIDNKDENMPKFSYYKLYCHFEPKKPKKEIPLKDCFSFLC